MLAKINHVLPLTTIIRERKMPLPGTVLVRIGQKVTPGDMIAETNFAREHVLIEVGRKLGLSGDAADKFIKVKKGDKVTKDMLVADRGGLSGKDVLSPTDGRVMLVGGGQILLERGTAAIELKAGMPGTVTNLIEGRGAIIQTTGSLIQGAWGNNRSDFGLMLNLADTPDAVLTTRQLDVSLRGSVLLAGHCETADVLQTAAEMPVRGLILTSISPNIIGTAMQMKYPIIVIEGFGKRIMNASAYKLLSTNVKREVAINAETDPGNNTRPEIIIPLPVAQDPPEPRNSEMFASGQTVRILREPKTGVIGTISYIKNGLTLLPSGIRTEAADVRLENGETVTIPLANLEIIG